MFIVQACLVGTCVAFCLGAGTYVACLRVCRPYGTWLDEIAFVELNAVFFQKLYELVTN